MKNALVMIVAVSCLGLTACGPNADELASIKANQDHRWLVQDRAIQQEINNAEERYIRITQGDYAATTFNLCKFSAPTVAKNQKECKKIEARMKRDQAKQPAW